MAFGIEIINNNDRILIDNNYANFQFFSTTVSTTTPNSAYPGLANTVTSDLIVARANTSSNGVVGKSISGRWATALQGASSSTLYYAIRRFDSYPSGTSGYSLEVYANTGNLNFTANITKNFEIIATGTFNAFTANVTGISFPSSTTWYSEFFKYFVVVNNTFSSYEVIAPPFVTEIYHTGYSYEWANSTHGRININSYLIQAGTTYKPNRTFHYMILKEIT